MRESQRKSIPRIFPPCWKGLRKPSAANSQPMPRSKPRFVASSNEAPLHAACGSGSRRDRRLYPRTQPQAALRVRAAILESLQSLVLFPHIGRQQKVEGVRKLVTRRYPYLVYYTADDDAQEIIILAIQHPAREREHSDA